MGFLSSFFVSTSSLEFPEFLSCCGVFVHHLHVATGVGLKCTYKEATSLGFHIQHIVDLVEPP